MYFSLSASDLEMRAQEQIQQEGIRITAARTSASYPWKIVTRLLKIAHVTPLKRSTRNKYSNASFNYSDPLSPSSSTSSRNSSTKCGESILKSSSDKILLTQICCRSIPPVGALSLNTSSCYLSWNGLFSRYLVDSVSTGAGLSVECSSFEMRVSMGTTHTDS